MKRFLFAIPIFLCITQGVMAQTFDYGVTLGGNMSNFVEKNNDNFVSDKVFGYEIGGVLEVELFDYFLVSTAITIHREGGVVYDSIDYLNNSRYKNNISFTNLRLPLEVGGRYQFGDFTVFGTVGPYLSVSMVGSISKDMINTEIFTYMNADPDGFESDFAAGFNPEYYNDSWSLQEEFYNYNDAYNYAYQNALNELNRFRDDEKTSVVYGESTSYYKRFSTGLNFSLGMNYKQYQAKFEYSYGLSNIANEDLALYKTTTSVFAFSVAYFISR